MKKRSVVEADLIIQRKELVADTACLHGKLFLIAEDEPLIVMLYLEFFNTVGAHPPLVARSISSALRMLDEHQVDGVVLDINLCGKESWIVATSARASKVPVVVSTGQFAIRLPEALNDIQIVKKPFAIHEFAYALSKLFADHENSSIDQNQFI